MFSKSLDDLFGFQEEKKEDTHEEAQNPSHEHSAGCCQHSVEDEFEPPAKVAEDDIPRDVDPFLSGLDSLIQEAGLDPEMEKRRKTPLTSGNLQAHDWMIGREKTFSDDPYKFRCRRCLKWVTVGNEQTIGEALDQQGVDPNCSQIVMDEVMRS